MIRASAAGSISAAPMPWMARKTMIHVSSKEPAGVSPQRADAVANMITPITTILTFPSVSPRRPPRAKVAESASR